MTRDTYELEDQLREEGGLSLPQTLCRCDPEQLVFDAPESSATLACPVCEETFPAAEAKGERACSPICKEVMRRENIPFRRRWAS